MMLEYMSVLKVECRILAVLQQQVTDFLPLRIREGSITVCHRVDSFLLMRRLLRLSLYLSSGVTFVAY